MDNLWNRRYGRLSNWNVRTFYGQADRNELQKYVDKVQR